MSSTKSPRGARAQTPSPSPSGPDPVPDGVRALIGLFGAELAEVRFPDVDREVLEGAAGAVQAADAEVTRLFAELEAAQVKLAEQKQALGKLAERGAAYARVFAADDEALLEKIEGLDLGGPKRAGRKPKAKPAKAVTRPRKTPPPAPDEAEASGEAKRSA